MLAGAGSGKTRVLTTRIAWLICTGQVGPHGILAVTFTNKAAREMLTRLSAMLPIEPRGMWIGTFHGLANRMLRAHHRDAGLPHTFQILDSQDQLAAIKRLLRALNVDDEKFPPKSLQHFVNAAKEEGRRAGAVEAYDEHTRRMVELYAAYDEQCQREGVVDFAELLLRSHELLARNAPLREHYRARFRHILVDEFQDTNTLQYEWLKLLAGESSVLFAVGDDDQSIYSFRGARVANMAAFEREFRVMHLIRLEQNYRSHANILDCANALIAHNRNRLGKNLWTDAGEGEPVRVRESLGDAQEAQWLVEEIRSLVAEGWMRSDIAVLYRSNAQSRVLEHALFSAGVAYRVYGGLRFFERAEVKHALAYLRLMENPDDDGAFLRVANFPARGIGARTLESLQDQARRGAGSLLASVASVAGAGGSRLAAFAQLVVRLRADTQALPLPEVVAHVIEASGLVAHYRNEREGQERVENLRELVNAAASFVAEEGIATDTPANLGVSGSPASAPPTGRADDAPADDAYDAPAGQPGDVGGFAAPGAVQTTPLAAFLAHASLEAGENQAGEGVDAVQMMTVHSAKGLEFDAVFLTGLEEGLFPHENSIADAQGLEEERRLMYVAITRARKRLYLSFAQTRMLHGHTRYNLRSRFLDELPPALLKWLGPGPRPGGARDGAASFGWNAPGLGQASAWRTGAGGRACVGARDGIVPDTFDTGRGTGFRVGQNVAHARFGEGVIVAIEGSGDDARAQVRFAREGTKWLALAVARLEASGS